MADKKPYEFKEGKELVSFKRQNAGGGTTIRLSEVTMTAYGRKTAFVKLAEVSGTGFEKSMLIQAQDYVKLVKLIKAAPDYTVPKGDTQEEHLIEVQPETPQKMTAVDRRQLSRLSEAAEPEKAQKKATTAKASPAPPQPEPPKETPRPRLKAPQVTPVPEPPPAPPKGRVKAEQAVLPIVEATPPNKRGRGKLTVSATQVEAVNKATAPKEAKKGKGGRRAS